MASSTATEPGWLAARRARAVDLIAELPQPAFRGTPGWEFTPIDKLDLDAHPAARAGDPGDASDVLEVPSGARRGTLEPPLVEADGGELPAGGGQPTVLPLELAAQLRPELLEPYLGAAVDPRNPFIARNDAHWSDGWLVHVPRNTRVAEPIVLTTLHEASTVLHHRVLVVLEEGAEAEVWAQQLSADGDGDGLANGVTELFVGDGARLRFLDVQSLSERTWVFGAGRAIVQRDGRLEWTALGFGSANGKVFLETNLAGPGAHAEVTGAYATHGRQHVDFDTLQEHAAPNTTSDLAFRGILAGRSSTVWRGMIKVDPGAQRTDAFQESRNLLLSKRAHADAIPGLEILADDVRCTHAAAIAQIDPDQLFYLRSHGLPDEDARRLVIEGFLQALLERFGDGAMRDAVAGALARRIELVLG
ncbi:MAG: Fe-S cluster assembly protein SufD [Solirubrobacteraceae bacterium]